MNKITCKECVRTCCDGMEIRRKNKDTGVDPNELESGSLLVVQGVIWRKLKSGLWRCIALILKLVYARFENIGRIYAEIRCCGFSKDIKRKQVSNIDEAIDLQSYDNYGLFFSVVPSDLMKEV